MSCRGLIELAHICKLQMELLHLDTSVILQRNADGTFVQLGGRVDDARKAYAQLADMAIPRLPQIVNVLRAAVDVCELRAIHAPAAHREEAIGELHKALIELETT